MNGRFLDLAFFNSARLFSPCHYLEDVHGRERNSKRWLEKLFQHLPHTSCEREESKTTFDFEACLKKLHAFVDTLHVNCEGSSMKDAWRIFCVTKLHTNFPNMSKLWQAILYIPIGIVACERGFSRQNIRKDIRRTKLSLATIDALMRVSITGLESSMVEWDRVYEIWKDAKERRFLNIKGCLCHTIIFNVLPKHFLLMDFNLELSNLAIVIFFLEAYISFN